MVYTQESAEVIALRVLGWLAGNSELLPIFQGSTGAGETELREGAQDSTFLGAVLDFVMLDDSWVIECCEALKVPNETLMQARQALPGGEQVNWT